MSSIVNAVAIAILLAGCSAAQSTEAPATPTSGKATPPGTLHSIKVNGNSLYSVADIAKATGLKIGQHVDRAVIDKARQRLQSTELFNSVAYQYRLGGGANVYYDVTFDITENTQLFPVRFERLSKPADVVRSCLAEHVELYAEKIPGTEGVLNRYKAAVDQCLDAKKPGEGVKVAISNDDPQQLTVLFTPNTPTPTISRVEVSGNQAVDTGTILRAVNQVAVGAPLSDTRLKMILEGTIRPLYAARGYAAVSFPKIETEPEKSNLGVVVKVEIHDGPAFKLGSVRFRGSGLDEDEIRSTIPIKPGQPYNSEQVEKYRMDLAHSLRRKGFLDATIGLETQTEDAKRAVNVLYNVTPGSTYNFHKLDIQGLDVTSEPVIAKLWGEKVGQPFNPDYPDFFLKRVQEQGLFDHLADTHSDYTADASTHNVTVHLYFKGGESKGDKARHKQEEKEKQKSDGNWSPY
jgi:outer membrane protein insertion porin family